jgi:hypothetical protein
MGRLTFYDNAIEKVNAKDPCIGFAKICEVNNVPSNHGGTVLDCTYLNQTNIFQISWLIVYMESTHAVEIAKDIYEASFQEGKLSLSEIATFDQPILITDDPNTVKDKQGYHSIKKLNNYDIARNDAQDKELLELFPLIIKYVSHISGKDVMQVLRDGLLRFENKVV